MKNSRIHIPQPRSSFISIQCQECGTSRVVFSASSLKINCEKCNFSRILRTSNFSMRASADVYNYGVCCNPDCKHEWEEVS